MSVSTKHINDILDRADQLFSGHEVDAAIGRMADEIRERIGATTPLVLCVLTGGIVATGQLLPRLDFPLELDYLHASRYRGDTQGNALEWLCRPSVPLQGRTILVVDDILDEGLTLAAISDYCRKEGAAAVYSAVLVEKLHDRRDQGLLADFIGVQVEDHYVFGHGMDYKGFLRNIPGIHAVRNQ